jgi:EmrB/QacA subfamily drug resistance transporter
MRIASLRPRSRSKRAAHVAPAPHRERPRQDYRLTLAVLATSTLAYSVSQTMVGPALPEIQQRLDVRQDQLAWVLTVYLLTASVATPIAGRLGDMFGRHRTLFWTLVLFGAGLVIAALAPSFGILVAGRGVQGLGGAVFPLAFGVIRDEFPRGRVASGIGLVSATWGVGGGAGLVVAGPVVDSLGYEWIFWLSSIAVLAATIMTVRFVPESPVRRRARIDWTGAALLSGGLLCVLLALSEGNRWGWAAPATIGLVAAGAVILVIWARVEWRTEAPLIDMRMMARRGVWTTNLVGMLLGCGMFSTYLIAPQFVQTPEATGYGLGMSVTGAGLVMLPMTLMVLVGSPISGWLTTRVGSRLPALVGAALAAVASLLMAFLHQTIWEFALASALFGLGSGLSFAATTNLIVDHVDAGETGVATGVHTVLRAVGGALGSQIAASVVAGTVGLATGLPSEAGYTAAFAVLAGATALGFIAGTAIPRDRRGAPATSW